MTNYFDHYLPGLPFPYTIVRNIDGVFLNHDYQLIDDSRAKTMIEMELPVIVKPSIYSGLSMGVKRINSAQEIHELLSSSRRDYLVQRPVKQCAELAELSKKSVNVMRIITAIIDNKPVFLSASLRLNTGDSIADNTVTADGKGMLVTGVTSDGVLKEYGIYSCGLKETLTPHGKNRRNCHSEV